MILVEDQRSYERRQWDEYWRKREEQICRPAKDDEMTAAILEVMREHEMFLPLRTVIVPNLVVRKFPTKSRAEREAVKRKALVSISALRRIGRLERVGRRFMTLPRTDEKYRAWLKQIDDTCRSFPKPRLGLPW